MGARAAECKEHSSRLEDAEDGLPGFRLEGNGAAIPGLAHEPGGDPCATVGRFEVD